MNFKEIDNYIIYEDGRIFSKKFNRFIKSTLDKRKDRPINKCYYKVCLYKNGKRYTKSIHRLVAEAFIPNPNNLEMVDHIDQNPQNNDITNLRWCSRSTNTLNTGVQKNNRLGEKFISIKKVKTYIYYRFGIRQGNKYVISKFFKTLEEAIIFRNEWLKENPKYSL